ncbi:TPA: type II toxin-antitoxin system HicB family antitoxin [Streptococcus suis]|uniref:type II toxin-antitoxin system HicB family antitoxin n=1 Tax=Streptococcus TaxID=1301 RepID=UPI001558179E|nr:MULTISPECIES: type II toxin-antitoxin system HicB family antitoxin [Streptococcus]MBM7192611.1 type II toxin-antitoxin system HicB family antitoxin [Streptococcus suis]MBO4111829.1 type II toxin-antitoxin system HicB family antitoxin [Streptococcus suis]MBY0719257.1 type II toxin-antitoxin system HicB family antitoxin [Streptococcus sp. 2018110]MCO8206730.1 type II toxin-antitoxin system HicB family antitoxin [Streptococcus suis]MCO8211084.1 type II toxin-antitoxin system HicB family antito
MLVTYPALFYYDDTDGASSPYFVTFPDFEHSATQGEDMADAMAMASDWLGIHLADYIENGRDIPTPTPINTLSLADNNPFRDDEDIELNYDPNKSFISMVMVDVAEYLGSQEPIKKTLTIPRWADTLGRELGLNFSQTLTDAIADKKIHA